MPRLVVMLMPAPPVAIARSVPPVVTVISSKAPKSKYVDDAPAAAMSVITMPSRFQVFSAGGWPFDDT